MKKEHINYACIIVFCFSIGLTGCASNTQHMVIASTVTVIGIDISQNPATQTPHAKIGYNRGELAIVPTNRSQCEKKQGSNEIVCVPGQGQGAKDSADVLMELRFGSPISFQGNTGVYQRLAVGNTAVQQPGATLLFSKDNSGNPNALAVEAITNPQVAANWQLDAIDKAIKYIAPDSIINDNTLKEFLKCAGKNPEEIDKFLEQIKNKSPDEFRFFFRNSMALNPKVETCSKTK